MSLLLAVLLALATVQCSDAQVLVLTPAQAVQGISPAVAGALAEGIVQRVNITAAQLLANASRTRGSTQAPTAATKRNTGVTTGAARETSTPSSSSGGSGSLAQFESGPAPPRYAELPQLSGLPFFGVEAATGSSATSGINSSSSNSSSGSSGSSSSGSSGISSSSTGDRFTIGSGLLGRSSVLQTNSSIKGAAGSGSIGPSGGSGAPAEVPPVAPNGSGGTSPGAEPALPVPPISGEATPVTSGVSSSGGSVGTSTVAGGGSGGGPSNAAGSSASSSTSVTAAGASTVSSGSPGSGAGSGAGSGSGSGSGAGSGSIIGVGDPTAATLNATLAVGNTTTGLTSGGINGTAVPVVPMGVAANGSALDGQVLSAAERANSTSRQDSLVSSPRAAYTYAPVDAFAAPAQAADGAPPPPSRAQGGPAPAAAQGPDGASTGAGDRGVAAAPAAAASVGVAPEQAIPRSSGSGEASSIIAANTTMTPAVALAAKQAQQDASITSWVVCAWQLSNITDFARMAKDWRSGSVSALITKTAGLDPGQVEVMTTANVTLGLTFEGVRLGSDPAATVKGLKSAFADLALGFDPTLIVVSPVPLPSAVTATSAASSAAAAAAAFRNAAPLVLGGAQRRMLRSGSVKSGLSGSRGGIGGSGSSGGSGVEAPLRRKLLQAVPVVNSTGAGASTGAAANSSLSGPDRWGSSAYVAFTGLSPSSVQMLTRSVQLSCGSLLVGGKLPANCSSVFSYHLSKAGVPAAPSDSPSAQAPGAGLSATLLRAPTVTINVLVAVGFNRSWTDAGRNEQLGGWLADWNHVKLAMEAAGLDVSPDTVATWLQRPEVIYSALSTAREERHTQSLIIATALAVPLGVCLLALGGIGAAAVVRRRRAKQAVAAGDGGSAEDDVAAAGSGSVGGGSAHSRQRRAIAAGAGTVAGGRAKRRYLAPVLQINSDEAQRVEEMAAANLRGAALASPSGGGAASGSGALGAAHHAGGPAAAAAAGAASVGAGLCDEDSSEDEADLRPRLRSLGDSVTSAARFEEEEFREDGGGGGGGGGDDNGDGGGGGGLEITPASSRGAEVAWGAEARARALEDWAAEQRRQQQQHQQHQQQQQQQQRGAAMPWGLEPWRRSGGASATQTASGGADGADEALFSRRTSTAQGRGSQDTISSGGFLGTSPPTGALGAGAGLLTPTSPPQPIPGASRRPPAASGGSSHPSLPPLDPSPSGGPRGQAPGRGAAASSVMLPASGSLPRTASMPSPFGAYDFSSIAATTHTAGDGAGAGGAPLAGAVSGAAGYGLGHGGGSGFVAGGASGGGAFNRAGSGYFNRASSGVYTSEPALSSVGGSLAQDGSWVAAGLQESLALVSGVPGAAAAFEEDADNARGGRATG